MVGLIDDLDHITRSTFANEGDSIVLLGRCTNELGASEYLSRIHGMTAGAPPDCDADGEKKLIDALLSAIREGVVKSAHDCSDGGLAVALAECCIANRDAQIGADVDLTPFARFPMRALLFGEAQGRIIVSTATPERVAAIAREHGVEANVIGRVTSPSQPLIIRAGKATLSVSLKDMAAAYHDAIPTLMSRAPSDGALIEHVTVGSV